MSILKRIFLFIGALIVLQAAAILIGSMIAGGIVGARVPGQEAPKLAFQAGASFSVTYRPIIFAASFVMSALLAFGLRFLTLLIAVPIALLGFLGLQRLSAIQLERMKSMPLPAPLASRPSPSLAPFHIGRRAALLQPVRIIVPYGETVIPKGTLVTILSQSERAAEIRAPDGSTVTIPLTQIQQ